MALLDEINNIKISKHYSLRNTFTIYALDEIIGSLTTRINKKYFAKDYPELIKYYQYLYDNDLGIENYSGTRAGIEKRINEILNYGKNRSSYLYAELVDLDKDYPRASQLLHELKVEVIDSVLIHEYNFK